MGKFFFGVTIWVAVTAFFTALLYLGLSFAAGSAYVDDWNWILRLLMAYGAYRISKQVYIEVSEELR